MSSSAILSIQMYVDCPECDYYIDLLDENDDGEALLRQMVPRDGDHCDFECENVTCSYCEAVFDVKGRVW